MGDQNQNFNILGVRVSPITADEIHAYIDASIKEDRKSLILHANIKGLNLAHENTWFRDFLNSANIVFCDGAGVIVGAKILGYNIPERITYADWTWQLSRYAEVRGFSFFFLGANPGVGNKAADCLKARYPNLKVVGTYHGYFDKRANSLENKAVIERINQTKPDILIVGFGMPTQERWLIDNWDDIDAKIALTGGAVFDYVSGNLRRAPTWMTDNGLEWLGRLLIEPSRLWRRYLVGNPVFIWRVFRQRLGLLEL